MVFKVVISEKEESHQIEVDTNERQIIGLAIGDELSGDLIGLDGYTLKITGGSDKNGFPMKKDIEGPRRIKSLLSGGIGYKPKADGVKRRKTLRGNTISDDIVQINTIVTEAGNKSIDAILNPSTDEDESSEE
ncbi:MAG: 30S ribosomal protein S6e [Methanobrevibacter arboriphilus]|uniref:Small ribosomal subunit protein eS6 n=2 Tax=Methanobrevibacter arboriphilus TaxID=39441 RepID=A0A843ADM5_METAZ|nr:30S ribosomal protein S6e [Methanobrevibacter arboriphilus]MBF4469132.1 30S ribosomal protein S6e [Methanobrevibacter arboriphilus]MCC7561551.1 30S ribosomal protein S6e [Methanobrevibacter arboriphilus]BBL63008.1 30S ribosomal protein S6e [Methanobrevibacter arboriphilus]GLI12107.1 30S ribosomal protein S6e [Methanobrevibacter arboriphilus]